MEHRLGQVGSVVMGFLEGRLESLMEEEREEGMMESSGSSEAETLGASGDVSDVQGGDKDNVVGGVSPGEYKVGQPNTEGGGVDRADGEGSDGGWTWGMVQRESRGHPRELEWVQLRCIGQSGSSQDDSSDHYWRPNLA